MDFFFSDLYFQLLEIPNLSLIRLLLKLWEANHSTSLSTETFQPEYALGFGYEDNFILQNRGPLSSWAEPGRSTRVVFFEVCARGRRCNQQAIESKENYVIDSYCRRNVKLYDQNSVVCQLTSFKAQVQVQIHTNDALAWTLGRFSARAQVPWRAEKRLGVQANDAHLAAVSQCYRDGEMNSIEKVRQEISRQMATLNLM